MATITDSEWQAVLDYANLLKASYPDLAAAPPNGTPGRSISELADMLAEFWGRHQDTLIPVLTNLAIAALQALAAALGDIKAANPPGPS